MKLQLFLGISLLSLMCLMWLQGSQAQTASWDYVGQMIDNYAAVTDCIFLAGNTNAGPNYTHTKGTQLTSTSSRMSVASASKMAASAIIYRVIEEGYLSLDDKPSKYLSYWTTSNGDPRSAITLKTLLAFTSGFGADDACCGDNSFTMQSCAQQIYKNATGSNYYSPAGSSFYYTCNHLQVAGAMAEQATGLSWATLFTRFWKNPLAVSSKFTTWTPTNNPNVAGGLYCSTDEYMRFVMSLFDLSFFKSTSTYDLFYTDNTPSDSVTIVYTPLSVALPPQVWHYCQGNWLECEQKPFDSSCTARQVHSSPGKFGFYPRIDRVNNYWSIVARQDLTGLFVYAQSVELFQVIEGNVTALLTNSRATSTATSGTSTTTRSGSSTAATTTNPGTTQTGTGSTTNTVSSTATTTRTTTRSTSDASSVVHSSLVFLALLSVLQMVFV